MDITDWSTMNYLWKGKRKRERGRRRAENILSPMYLTPIRSNSKSFIRSIIDIIFFSKWSFLRICPIIHKHLPSIHIGITIHMDIHRTLVFHSMLIYQVYLILFIMINKSRIFSLILSECITTTSIFRII